MGIPISRAPGRRDHEVLGRRAAVRGSNNTPNYPASHGYVRVSVSSMDWIWDSGIMPMRIPVWVHNGG